MSLIFSINSIMCYNKEVSLFTFILILFVSYKFLKRGLNNDIFLGIFILSYGFMQFIEAIIWTGFDYNILSLNKIGTVMVALLLYLHPIAITFGLYYDKYYKDIINQVLFKCFFAIAVVFLLVGIVRVYLNINKIKSIKGDYLEWIIPSNYSLIVVFELLITAIYIIQKNPTFGLIIILYYLIGAIVTYSYTKTKYFGSYWCWLVAIFSIVLYIINPYLQ